MLVGLSTLPPHIELKTSVYPFLEVRAAASIVMIIQQIVIAKVKSAYGIAKIGFYFIPVRHPNKAIIIPIIPIAKVPSPNPSSLLKFIPNLLWFSWETGIFPLYISPKVIAIIEVMV